MSTLTNTTYPRFAFYTVGATATQGPFNIPFPFADDNEVRVFVDGVENPNFTITHPSLYTAEGNTFTMDDPQSNCSIAVWSDIGDVRSTADTFVSIDLSKEIDRIFGLFQQMDQRGIWRKRDGTAFDGAGNRFTNIAEGVDDNDLVTKKYVDESAAGARSYSEASEASATAAAGSASDAADSAMAAAASASDALDDAAAAASSASDASGSATSSQKWAEGTEPGGAGTYSAKEYAESISGDADAAANSATAASTSASNASDDADAAASSASDAADSATAAQQYATSAALNGDVTQDADMKGFAIDNLSGINGGQLAGFRNRFINGEMRIAQRATSALSSAGAYEYLTADRWGSYTTGDTTQHDVVAGIGAFGSALQMVPGASATALTLEQRIEAADVLDLVGQTVTVSGYVEVDDVSGVTLDVAGYYPGALDDYSSSTNFGSVSAALGASGAVARFTSQITVDANCANGLGIKLTFGGIAGKTIKVTGFQLEPGAKATPFERRPYGAELSCCKRFFCSLTSNMRGVATGAQQYFAANVVLPVAMRATPTTIWSAGSSQNISFYTAYIQGPTGGREELRNSAAGGWYRLNGKLNVDAEL